MRTWLSAVVIVFLIFAVTIMAHAEGKIYEPQDPKYGTKKQYTNQQKEHRGLNDKKKVYTTCRLQKRIKSRIAMTGEITLRGKVLAVGGIKEKILAAKRAKIKEIILSIQNKADVKEINNQYTKGLTFHYVSEMSEVIDIALTNKPVKNPKKL